MPKAAKHCNTLQHIQQQHTASRCITLHHTASHCNMVPFALCVTVAVCCSVLQCVAVCCSVLQCVAVCCSLVQSIAACCSVLQCGLSLYYCRVFLDLYLLPLLQIYLLPSLLLLPSSATRCNTLQHTATHCHPVLRACACGHTLSRTHSPPFFLSCARARALVLVLPLSLCFTPWSLQKSLCLPLSHHHCRVLSLSSCLLPCLPLFVLLLSHYRLLLLVLTHILCVFLLLYHACCHCEQSK